MWTIEQLKTFKLAAEMQNFSRVADKLSISATAVGKQIKILEEEMGVQLFYRTTRHVALTDIGEAFYQQVKLILNQMKAADEMIAGHQGKVAGKLKIICPVYIGEWKVMPLIPEFMKCYPDIRLDIEVADRVPDLEMENIDISIGLVGVLPEPYVRRKLSEDRHIFCASPAYIKKFGLPKKPQDLSEHRFIAHTQRPHPALLMIGKQRVTVKPVMWANSTNLMLQACLGGVGVTQLHSRVVEYHLKNKLLVEVLPDYREPLEPLYLHFKKMDYVQPKLRVFIDYLLKHYSSE